MLCFAASAFGGLVTTIATMALLPLLAQLGLYFRSVEMVVVIVFGLTLIAAIAAKDLLKGLIAGFAGLMIGTIGVDPVFGTPRATFGLLELYDGVPLIPALIGLFAISEAFVMLEDETIVPQGRSRARQERPLGRHARRSADERQILVADDLDLDDRPDHRHPARRRRHHRGVPRLPLLQADVEDAGALRHRPSARRHRAGIRQQRRHLGHAGAGVRARHSRRHHRRDHDDRAAPITASCSARALFIERPDLVYGVYMQMMVCYLLMAAMILPLARYMSRVVLIPTRFLVPLILSLVTIAAFSERQYVFDMGLALFFGVIGYIARKTRYEVTAMLIGVLMGPLFEHYFLRAMRVGQGDLTHPVLLHARQCAVGDGGRRAGAALFAQPQAGRRAGAELHAPGMNRSRISQELSDDRHAADARA